MYLDPGFGGMIVQIVVAVGAVAGVVLFTMRKKLRELFGKGKGAKGGAPPQAGQAAEFKADDVVDMLEEPKNDSEQV